MILWRKGDSIISAGGLLVIKTGKFRLVDKFNLVVLNIVSSDSGEYSCEIDVFGNTHILRHQVDVLGKLE